ncbi:MAG: hypothetical protein WAV05_17605 [Anaerolineales bacterium]
MIEQTVLLKQFSPGLADSTTSRLRQEYQVYQKLFQSQPAVIQQYLNTQAAPLAEALIKNLPYVRFNLPDHVVCVPLSECSGESELIPVENREQSVGGIASRLTRTDLLTSLLQRFIHLEQSANQAIAISAGMLRYAMASYLIFQVLPAGKSVVYANIEGDDIPNIPLEKDFRKDNATATWVNVHRSETQIAERYEECQTPYVRAAQSFYLPQWVAFDDQGNLLTGSVQEAETYIASMQQYLFILNLAVLIAPYMVADEIYQQKRYGMLGQLINQGRCLARYQLQDIINTIKRRSMIHDLDRGLSISLPYFNDQTLMMEVYNFEVIPVGRVMFIPAFLVLAVRMQALKITQATHLSRFTRRQILIELSILERTFLR